MDFFKGIKYAALYTILMVLSGVMLEGCFQEQVPEHRYTFKGETVADFLEATPEQFRDFITILKRAETWGEMDTYGEYTCFAPTNSGFQAYLAKFEDSGKVVVMLENRNDRDRWSTQTAIENIIL